MKFIKKIRKEILNKSCYEMAKLMELGSTRNYIVFEEAQEALNAPKMIKFWRLSGLSAEEFLEIIEEEFVNDPQDS